MTLKPIWKVWKYFSKLDKLFFPIAYVLYILMYINDDTLKNFSTGDSCKVRKLK